MFTQAYQKIISWINYHSPIHLIYFLLLVSLVFSFKIPFVNQYSFWLGEYSDFLTMSLYLPLDVLVLTTLVWLLVAKKYLKFVYLAIGVGVVLVLLWANLSQFSYLLSAYSGFRIFVSICLGFLVINDIKPLNYQDNLLSILVILGVLQSVVAIGQFYFQSSLGLYFLGESSFTIETQGVAKTMAFGTEFIRSYGTLPHPNILGGFLAIISLLNLYLITKTTQFHVKLILIGSFSLIYAGLLFSMSRGAIIALIISLTLFLVQHTLAKRSIELNLWLIIFLPIIILTTIFSPIFQTRLNIHDQSFDERVIFIDSAVKMIKDHVFTGVGPVNSLLHMEQYSPVKLESWEIQPIHNVYLIWIVEWGIVGWLVISFFFWSIYQIFRKYLFILYNENQRDLNLDWITLLTSLSVLLGIILAIDHYFYTIWPMQILFWLFIAIVYKEVRSQA